MPMHNSAVAIPATDATIEVDVADMRAGISCALRDRLKLTRSMIPEMIHAAHHHPINADPGAACHAEEVRLKPLPR